MAQLQLQHAMTTMLLPIAAAATFALSPSTSNFSLAHNSIEAAGSAFYLGLSHPITYCPLSDSTTCPPGNSTLFAGLTSLWVEVPGGQQVFVAQNGALGFTQPHSTSTPPGSYVGGFVNETVVRNGTAETVFNWRSPDNSTGGLLACEKNLKVGNETATYQIFAHTPAFNQTDCITLDGLAPKGMSNNDFGAWEYT